MQKLIYVVCAGESSRERSIRRPARWTQSHLSAGGAFWRTPRKYFHNFISSTNNFRHLTQAKRSVRPLTKKPWDANISGPVLGKNLGEAYVSGRLPAEMIISLTAV